jgi:hypothetical protein
MLDRANACNQTDEHGQFDADEAEVAVQQVLKEISLKSHASLKVEDAENPEEPTHMFTELFGGIVYSSAVRAYNSEGWSDFSPVLSVETPSAKPEQCAQLLLLEATQNSLLMQYWAPYDNGAPVTSFEIAWKHAVGPRDRHNVRVLGREPDDCSHIAGTICIDLVKEGTRLSTGDTGKALLEGLEPGTDYELQICALNKHGPGLNSHVIRMQTAPGRPDAPADVRHSPSRNRLHHPGVQSSSRMNEDQNVICFA